MANRWIEFVRKWSANAGISYACAISKPECRAEYQTKYGNRKNLPRQTEQEMMGAEDVRSQAVRALEKTKKVTKKKLPLIIEDSNGEEEYILPGVTRTKLQRKAILIDSDDEEEYILPKQIKKLKLSQKTISAERVIPKLKPVMERLKMFQEDLQSQMERKKELTKKLKDKLGKELKTVLEEKNKLLELSKMMEEDKDVKEEITKIEKKIKKKKPLLIIEDDEDEIITQPFKKDDIIKSLQKRVGKLSVPKVRSLIDKLLIEFPNNEIQRRLKNAKRASHSIMMLKNVISLIVDDESFRDIESHQPIPDAETVRFAKVLDKILGE